MLRNFNFSNLALPCFIYLVIINLIASTNSVPEKNYSNLIIITIEKNNNKVENIYSENNMITLAPSLDCCCCFKNRLLLFFLLCFVVLKCTLYYIYCCGQIVLILSFFFLLFLLFVLLLLYYWYGYSYLKFIMTVTQCFSVSFGVFCYFSFFGKYIIIYFFCLLLLFLYFVFFFCFKKSFFFFLLVFVWVTCSSS